MRRLWVCGIALVLGCNLLKSKKGDDTSAAAGDASASVGASASAAAAAPPCTVETATTVDTGVRADSGLTLVVMTDGRLALGYATGDGVPKVAIVDTSGKASFADALDQHLRLSEKKPQNGKRMLLRVTPLGFMSGGMKMRVGVDLLDTRPDKTTYLRCGPADLAPFVSEGAPDDNGTGDEGNIVDCRTFSDGTKEWVLASVVSIASAMEGKLPMRWFVDYQAGKQPIDDVVLDERLYESKALEKPEPHVYQVPVGVGVPKTGYVFASRQDGALVLARRSATLEKEGDAVRFALGGAITMPALAANGHQGVVFVALSGTTDVLASTFAIEAKPAKPAKITLDDAQPPTAGDRNSLTASYTPKGDIFLAFADGPQTAKRARMTKLGGDLKSLVPVFDVSTEGNVSELRVAATGDSKAIVTYLAGAEIKTALVTCKPDSP